MLETLILTFFVVFIGELGDKSQIAAGTSSLLHKGQRLTVFTSSALALFSVTFLTTFAAAIIPASFVSHVIVVGGILLVLYSFYLLNQIFQEFEERAVLGADQKIVSTKKCFGVSF